jgi:acetyl-CoA synthetase
VKVREDLSIIAAFVVPAEGAACDPAAIVEFAARHLARYKLPREVVFVDALPRTPNGKVVRRELSLLMKEWTP